LLSDSVPFSMFLFSQSPNALDKGDGPYDTDVLGPDGVGYVWMQSSGTHEVDLRMTMCSLLLL
jgi:hypothetical protein